MRFTVLASGSAGNASLIEAGGFGTLLDAGLGPRQIASRLRAVGSSCEHVRAVVLTHIHRDHWNESTFCWMERKRVVLHCHPSHAAYLAGMSLNFSVLQRSGLVRSYQPYQQISLTSALSCIPFALRHDSGDTFGFRFVHATDLFGAGYSLAYAADLGCWDRAVVEALREVDVLALEFNHDEIMERSSGRNPRLIARVLGDDGHLSNEQAALLLQAIVQQSVPGRLRHLVQLHLSRDCNHPDLARQTAQEVLGRLGADVEVHTASQDHPVPTLDLRGANGRAAKYAQRSRKKRAPACRTTFLPGMGDAVATAATAG
jgi:phosphoribosyl 1,2-cyclic phosphodiesterase